MDKNLKRRQEISVKIRKDKQEETRKNHRTLEEELPLWPNVGTQLPPSTQSTPENFIKFPIPENDDDKNDDITNPSISLENKCNSIYQGLYSDNYEILITSIKKIRKLISNQMNQSQYLFDFKIVHRLVEILSFIKNEKHPSENSKKNEKLRFEILWVITNICASEYNDNNTKNIIEIGAIPYIIDILKNSDNTETRIQCIWTFGNIIADIKNESYEWIQTVLELIIREIDFFLENVHRNIFKYHIQEVIWSFCNFGIYKYHSFTSVITSVFSKLLTNSDKLTNGCLNEIFVTLKKIPSRAIVESGLYKYIMLYDKLQDTEKNIMIDIIGNIVYSNKKYIDKLIDDMDLYYHFNTILKKPETKTNIKIKILRIFTTTLTNNKRIIIADYRGLIDTILKENTDNITLKEEIIECIICIAKNDGIPSAYYTFHANRARIIELIEEFFTLNSYNIGLMLELLYTLNDNHELLSENMLEQIESLSLNQNEEISYIAQNLIHEAEYYSVIRPN
jgi:hypothetical protein